MDVFFFFLNCAARHRSSSSLIFSVVRVDSAGCVERNEVVVGK